MELQLPIEEVLCSTLPASTGQVIGTSRQGRTIRGFRYGHGPLRISLIAGCHADEPVGPRMLDRLVAFLAAQTPDSPWLSRSTWLIVPHANPDGEARNKAWTRHLPPGLLPTEDRSGYPLEPYLRHVIRELPGDDVEFGFPRDSQDDGARPENQAVARFLASAAPFALHASFHGMAFAAGPWFLLEKAWIERTASLRQRLRQRVAEMGYVLHDIDRRGDKGFHRIDEGFTTRPDSVAMIEHFVAAGDTATAALFRPSSMEFVRSLGGDPLTLVSEMPLFLLPAEHYASGDPIRPAAVESLRRALAEDGDDSLSTVVQRVRLRPMPVLDQMRLQLEYLNASLVAVAAAI